MPSLLQSLSNMVGCFYWLYHAPQLYSPPGYGSLEHRETSLYTCTQISLSLWICGSYAQDILILRAMSVPHDLSLSATPCHSLLFPKQRMSLACAYSLPYCEITLNIILAEDCFAVWNRWHVSSQLGFSIPPFTVLMLRLLDQAYLCADCIL